MEIKHISQSFFFGSGADLIATHIFVASQPLVSEKKKRPSSSGSYKKCYHKLHCLVAMLCSMCRYQMPEWLIGFCFFSKSTLDCSIGNHICFCIHAYCMWLHLGLLVHVYIYFDFWRVRVVGVCAFSQVSGLD